jgi:hypothetical protein
MTVSRRIRDQKTRKVTTARWFTLDLRHHSLVLMLQKMAVKQGCAADN